MSKIESSKCKKEMQTCLFLLDLAEGNPEFAWNSASNVVVQLFY